MLYQIGMLEEKQKWQNEDFFREFDEKMKKDQIKYDKEVSKIKDLFAQMKFEFDNQDTKLKEFKTDICQSNAQIQGKVLKFEKEIAQLHESDQLFSYLSEYINI
jgi:hypothetical protein